MDSSNPISSLEAQRNHFRAFLVSRLGNEAEVDDLLQNSLVKALHSAGSVRDEEKLISWFYQLLRHALIDHVRSRKTTRVREEVWAEQTAIENDPGVHRNICTCFEALLPELKPREAELIQRVELGNESVANAAHELGMTPNNASVTLHRARKALREKLEVFCGSCADGACLDCDCGEPGDH